MAVSQPFLNYPVTQGFGTTSYSGEPTVSALSGVLTPAESAGLSPASYFHTGIDYAAPAGTPIYAPAAGTVTQAGWDTTGYGNRVTESTSSGLSALFGHLSLIVATPGETVKAGQLLGYSGSTGNASGPHVHFSVLNQQGEYIDPITGLAAIQAGTPLSPVANPASAQGTTQGVATQQANTAPAAQASSASESWSAWVGHAAVALLLAVLGLVLIVLGIVILARHELPKVVEGVAEGAA